MGVDMSLKRLVHIGLAHALEVGVIERLGSLTGGFGGGVVGGKAAQLLREHFTLTAAQVGQALQDSFGYAMAAIAIGVAPEAQARSLWNRLVASKVTREFSCQVLAEYLEPFAQERGLAGEALGTLRSQAVIMCQALARRKEELFPDSRFPEADLAALLQESFSAEVSALVLEQVGPVDPAELAELLAYRDLLGDAVLFFFHERMRKDERVEKTLAALQREGLWADLRDVKAAQSALQDMLGARLTELQGQLTQQQAIVIQATQAGDYAQLPALAQTLQALKTDIGSVQGRLADLPERLQEVQAAWRAVDGRVIELGERLGAWGELMTVGFNEVLSGLEVLGEEMHRARAAAEQARDAAQETGRKVDDGVIQIRTDIDGVAQRVGALSGTLGALVELMRHQQLDPQVKARDEFIQHNSASRGLIQQAAAELDHLPRTNREYSLAVITVGSALASTAEGLARAEQLFEQARAAAQSPAETALASFNLFQVRLRRKDYPQALEALQTAIGIDAARYALHDPTKYPIERILGAGGMGCAFLCRDRLRGQVVVKAFWEAHKGPIEQVFREVLMLRDLAGGYVPTPLDYGYADPYAQEHPYIVTEYIPEAIDGEAWLERHGKLDLADGLQVGLQAAKGLQIAHEAGICHLDLKPANLLLKRTNGRLEVKMIDFGLARAVTSLKQEAAAQRSYSGHSRMVQDIFGTLEYAPPEQLGETRYGPPGPRRAIYTPSGRRCTG